MFILSHPKFISINAQGAKLKSS